MTATSPNIALAVTGPEARASCRRAKAIEEGVLANVSEVARTGGFRWPVAVTANAWSLITGGRRGICTPGVYERLYDALWQAAAAIRVEEQPEGNTVCYHIVLQYGLQLSATLKIVAESGDMGEPVITIMLPDEEGWR